MSDPIDHITTARDILFDVCNLKHYSHHTHYKSGSSNSPFASAAKTSEKKRKAHCQCQNFAPKVCISCSECKCEYKGQDDREAKLRARAARLGEALGTLSSVAYEVMRDFDFSDPANLAPPCVEPETYSKRLEHKLNAAIENMKRIAGNTIREAFTTEQECIREEIHRANKVRASYEKRNNLIKELLATEKHFHEGLGVILDVWKPEMTSAGLVDPFIDDVFFKPIPAIKELSSDLIQDFTKVLSCSYENQNLGKILCKKAERFNVFKPSCLSQQDATAMTTKLSMNNTFKEMQNRLKKLPNITQNLAEYIFTPAQRMTRYPLLLNGIINATEKRHPDYQNLVTFVDKLKSILDEVNQKNAQQSSLDLFFSLKDKIKWTHCEYDLMASKAIVVFHGKVNWSFTSTDGDRETSGNYLFMLNSIIMACSEEKGRNYTEHETLFVDSTTLKDTDSKKNELTLRAKPRKGNVISSVGTLVIQSADYLSLMNYKRFFDDCKEKVPQFPLIPAGKGATPIVILGKSRSAKSSDTASVTPPPPLSTSSHLGEEAAIEPISPKGSRNGECMTSHRKKIRKVKKPEINSAIELFFQKEAAPVTQAFVPVLQNGTPKKKRGESGKESNADSADSRSADEDSETPRMFSLNLNGSSGGSSGGGLGSSSRSKKSRRSTASLK